MIVDILLNRFISVTRSMPKLIFLVNGSATSAVGVRTQTLIQHLDLTWETCVQYRSSPKWKGIFSFLYAALQFRPDIIYVMDTAYTGVVAGQLAKRFIGCSLITDTGDAAFELAKSVGVYSNLELALINTVERISLLKSDYLIVRGTYHKHWLFQQGIQRVEVVPDGIEVNRVACQDSNQAKASLGLNNHLVVGMVGTMSWSARHKMCYGWDLVEALAFLKNLPVKALLVGDGNGRLILEKRAEELGVRDRIVFTGNIPYEQLSHYLAAMDVCVSTQSNDIVGMVRTTGKLPLYLAHGKYVIATDVGEARRVLPGVGCLLPYQGVRDDDHPLRLAEHLRLLVAQPNLMQGIPEKAKQVAKDNFDYPMLAKQVEQICQHLVNSP